MTRARSLSQLANSSVFTVATNNRVGIGSEVPTAKLDVDGTLNVSGNATIGGVATYEDVTNVDSVGIVTARSGVSVPDGQKILLGTSNDLEIYHDGTHSYIKNEGSGNLYIDGDTDDLVLQAGDDIRIQTQGNENAINCVGNGAVEIYYNNSKKLETTSTGVSITGAGTFSSSITAQNTILANRTGSTQTAFQATLSGVTKVDIKAGGAATFAGTVKSGALDLSNTSAAGIEVRSTGEILLQRPSSQGTSSLIDGRLGNTQNVNILGNGDATFKGKLDVGQTYTGAEIARFGKTATGATSYLAFHTENANYAFIGTGDQLIAGGGASDFGIRAQGNILFSSGGNSERMRIDSSGRVLIGTLTEGYSDADDLTVAASGNAGITIRSGTTNAGAIYFSSGTSGNSEYRGYIEYSQNSAFLRFGTAAAEQMRIDSAGRLLIGTTAGAAGRIVHASNSGNNSAYFHSTNGSSGTGSQDGIVMGMGDATNAYFWNYESGSIVFATSATSRMTIDSAGLVGINMTPSNTASNTYPLQIYSPGSQCFLTLGNSNTGSGPSNGLVLGNDGSSAYIWNRENTPIQFATNNTERVRIDSSGNMGLGTNNPAKKLHISDTSGPAQIRITGSSGSSDIYADANIYFQPNGTTRVTMNSSGQLLVGTTSSRSGATTYGSTAPAVLIERAVNSHSNADLMLINNSSSAYYPKLTLATTKGSTANSHGNIGPSEAMGYIVFAGSDGTNLIEGARIAGITDAATSTTNMPTRLSFYTNGGSASSPTERFRIDRVGQNKMLSGSSTSTLELRNGSGSGTSNRLLYGLHSATALNNGTPIYSIFTNGTVGTPSDIRLKKNVETTRDGYLSDLASLRVVKYHWNTQEDTEPKELGLIAQEVETVFPGLIHTEGEGDEEVKEIKRSVIPMMLLKALQEANAKIETLEEKVAALEG